VGELPLVLQKAFLRVLQEHRFRPLGGNREIESDFRLVAATNPVL
jgi:two-component system NtrC family response regulator